MSDTANNSAPKPVTMDAKKFVQRLNSGAQAKIHVIGEKVKEMGLRVGKTYELATLDSESLIFEDKDSHTYHVADIKKNGDKLSLENIRPIKVVEGDGKSGDYDKTLTGLSKAVSEGDSKGADKLFGLLCGGFKFRETIIPESGIVRLRDGSTRKVSVESRIVPEDRKKRIIESLKKALADDVNITEGRVVSATFGGTDKIRIPINDWTRCRLRANELKVAAEGAYKSAAFSKLIKNCAALVSEGRLKDAVQLARPLLDEQQEFCMLTRPQFTELVENALATQCEFNPFLARDTAKLLYRANLKINRDSIIESWKKAAQVAHESSLFEDATELDDAQDTAEFEGKYEGYLDGVFNEADDVVTSKAKVYRMCLQILASVLSNVEASAEDADALTQMAEALASNPDHSTVMQAEELLAQIADDIIDAVETLHTFDEKGGEDESGGDEGEMGEEPVELPDLDGEMGGGPGGDMGLPPMGGDEGGLDDAGGPPLGDEPEDEGGAEGEEEGEKKEPVKDFGESKLRSMPINERREYAIRKFGHVFIEDENIDELEAEAESWEINGSRYILDEGVDESLEQMNRLIKRCGEIGPDALGVKNRFETLRENIMIHGDVLGKHDPYAETLKKRGRPMQPGLKADSEYRGWVTESELPLGKAEGKGVAAKEPKDVDGTDGTGAKYVKGKVAEGSADMDKKGGKGVADKEKSKDGVPSASNKFGGKLKKVSSEGASSFLDTLEEELAALDSPSGEGVAAKSPKDSDGRSASNSAAPGGVEGAGELPMERGDGEGVAKKTVTDSDGADGGSAFGESQYKWGTNASKRRQSGRRKNKLNPKNRELDEEVKVSVSGAALDGNEISYAATFPEGDPQQIISQVMDSMAAMGGEVEAPETPEAPEDLGDDLGGSGGDDLGGDDMGGDDLGGDDMGGGLGGAGGALGAPGPSADSAAQPGDIESEIEAALGEPEDIDLGAAPKSPESQTAPKPEAKKSKPSAE